MSKKIKNKIILITGLPGSGKTSLANKLKPKISKILGSTIVINGDDIRNIFNLKNYSMEERLKLDLPYLKLANFILSQGVAVILTSVSIADEVRSKFKKNNKILFVHINSTLKSRQKFKKRIYSKKIDVPGKNQLIKKPHIVDIFIKNTGDDDLETVSKNMWLKILKFL